MFISTVLMSKKHIIYVNSGDFLIIYFVECPRIITSGHFNTLKAIENEGLFTN